MKVLVFHSTSQTEFINSHKAFKGSGQYYVWYLQMGKKEQKYQKISLGQTKYYLSPCQQPCPPQLTPLTRSAPPHWPHPHTPSLCFRFHCSRSNPFYNYVTTTPRRPLPAPEVTVQISHLSDSSTILTPWSSHDTFFSKCLLQKWFISPEFSCYIDPQNFPPQLYSPLWQFLQEENRLGLGKQIFDE